MKNLIILIGAITLLASCNSKEIPDNITSTTNLNIRTATGRNGIISPYSKPMPDGACIGVSTMQNGNNEPSNIKCIKSGENWQSSFNITTNDKQRTLSAYYPFVDNVTDLTKVPLKIDGTQYMWAKGVTNASSETTLIFDHVLTCLNLILQSKSNEQLAVSGVKIRSCNGKAVLPTTKAELSFNASNGQIEGLVADTEQTVDFMLSGESILFDPNNNNQQVISVATLPVAFNDSELEFVLMINNQEVVIPINTEKTKASSIGWEQGNLYTYSVSLATNSATAVNSNISAWVDVPNIRLNITSGDYYMYSKDRKICFNNKQNASRDISKSEGTIKFSFFSNISENISSKINTIFDATSMLSRPINITRTAMPQNVDVVDGERVLGDWRYEVTVAISPNLYEQMKRQSKVKIMYNGELLSSFTIYQEASDWKYQEIAIGNRIWMDRNLGALSPREAGGYFFVGRILPYPYYNSSLSVKYDQQFFIKGKNPVSPWKNNNLAALKSLDNIYHDGSGKDATIDPCPEGWHIPTMSEFMTLVDPQIDSQTNFGASATLPWPFFRRDIVSENEVSDLTNNIKYKFTGDASTMKMILQMRDNATNNEIIFPIVSYLNSNGTTGDMYTLNLRTSTISTGTPDAQRFVFFGGGATGNNRRLGFNTTKLAFASQIRCIKNIS